MNSVLVCCLPIPNLVLEYIMHFPISILIVWWFRGWVKTHEKSFEHNLVLLSSWYGSEKAASICQKKFPSKEKINLLSRNPYWKVKKYIYFTFTWWWKIEKFSWQWDRSTPTHYWKERRNLSSQQTQSVFYTRTAFSFIWRRFLMKKFISTPHNLRQRPPQQDLKITERLREALPKKKSQNCGLFP